MTATPSFSHTNPNLYKHYVLLRTMVIVSTISRGTRMDQIYLPKLRPPGFAVGEAVEIRPTKKQKRNFYTYKVTKLEPLKILIKDEIFDYFEQVDNVLITGSFLEEGFQFNDIDILLIDHLQPQPDWQKHFKDTLGIKAQFICLDRNSLQQGLQQDPLFQMMMSKYLAKKRELFQYKNKFNYKLLDLHLFKSKTLMDSFDILTGKEKYGLVRNTLAICLFLNEKQLSKEIVDQEMERLFGKGIVEKVRKNIVEKGTFLRKFRKVYNEVQVLIMEKIGKESK